MSRLSCSSYLCPVASTTQNVLILDMSLCGCRPRCECAVDNDDELKRDDLSGDLDLVRKAQSFRMEGRAWMGVRKGRPIQRGQFAIQVSD